jgi:hypothetical protein
MKDNDHKGGSPAGAGATAETTTSPPAKGGNQAKAVGTTPSGYSAPKTTAPARTVSRPPAKVHAVFLTRKTLAGPQYPGGCKTFSPSREETYRPHKGGPVKKRTIPADTWTFDKPDFDNLAKQGVVARVGGQPTPDGGEK